MGTISLIHDEAYIIGTDYANLIMHMRNITTPWHRCFRKACSRLGAGTQFPPSSWNNYTASLACFLRPLFPWVSAPLFHGVSSKKHVNMPAVHRTPSVMNDTSLRFVRPGIGPIGKLCHLSETVSPAFVVARSNPCNIRRSWRSLSSSFLSLPWLRKHPHRETSAQRGCVWERVVFWGVHARLLFC